MVIVETKAFTRRVQEELTAEQYRLLQADLVDNPELGVVIPRGGGLRKLRWALPGRGKRGGARVIYYWAVAEDHLVMLFIFPKNERSDLTPDELKLLRKAIEREYP